MKPNNAENINLKEFVCPSCQGQLTLAHDSLSCISCSKDYPIINGIPDFREKDEYWCNVDRATMQTMNTKARESGDWLTTARELVPKYIGHFEPLDRGDAQFLWPADSNSRILDAGSMWGGLTIPVAQHCGEIYAIDKTIETLEFLKIRAAQMGLDNIHVAASPVQKVPFPDKYFDMVLLSGVLEWVALDQEVTLETHWGKRRTDTKVYQENPRVVQLKVLRELQRVIKPGGYLYLAIENRFGYLYFVGRPDDHVNIQYVSFLPRFLANAITRHKLNFDYRTYVYSQTGYSDLLRESGFEDDMEFYGVFDHYIKPKYIIPPQFIKYWKYQVLPINHPLAPLYARLAAKIFPRSLLKHVSPSFIAIARTPGGTDKKQARLVQILIKAGVLQENMTEDIKLIKAGGRPGNYHTANFLICKGDETRPAYFCKVCRSQEYTDILQDEAENLKTVNRLLKNTELEECVPQLVYFGTIESITFLVTGFIDGELSRFDPNLKLSKSNLGKLDESIPLAIDFLVKFQNHTKNRDVEAASYLLTVIEKQREILNSKGKLSINMDSNIQELKEKVECLQGLTIPLCAIQGDYDFFCNILFGAGKAEGIVDFEHFESEGLPFLDLASLIFNPILMSYNNYKTNLPFYDFLQKNGLMSYIGKWLRLYAELSGISTKILKHFASMAALEQRTKEYPYYRDPNTLPMYSEEAFIELMSLKIDL